MHTLHQVVHGTFCCHSVVIAATSLALCAGKGSKGQGGAVPPWAPREVMLCSHLCLPQQLPGPETKLFVEMACVAVSHRTTCPATLSPCLSMSHDCRRSLLQSGSALSV